MGWWPWSRNGGAVVEERSGDYAAAIIDQLLSTAEGDSTTPTIRGVAVARACIALYGRAFAAAVPVGSRTAPLTPDLLGHLGRSLCFPGEAVYAIDVRGGRIVIRPCAWWDLTGSADPSTWVYRVDLAGPSTTETRILSADSVIHIRAEIDAAQPWEGTSALRGAALSRTLASQLERRLGEEAGAPVAHLVAVPTDGGDTALDAVRSGIKGAKGRAVLVEAVESMADIPSAAPKRGWKAARLGADPPEHAVKLRQDVQIAICAAAGVPPSLVLGSQGTDRRESYRQWIATTVRPLAKVAEAAISTALDAEVTLDFGALTSADIAGRAKALETLVRAGVPLAEARELAGL